MLLCCSERVCQASERLYVVYSVYESIKKHSVFALIVQGSVSGYSTDDAEPVLIFTYIKFIYLEIFVLAILSPLDEQDNYVLK